MHMRATNYLPYLHTFREGLLAVLQLSWGQQCDNQCACTLQHEVRELERQLSDQAAAAEKALSHQQAIAAADRSSAQVGLRHLQCIECAVMTTLAVHLA